MAKSNQSGRNNNNPEGRNQYSGIMGTVKSNPMVSAAAAAGAAAAGLFLWNKRSQIGEQANRMGDKIGKWSEDMRASGKSSSSTETSQASAAVRDIDRSKAPSMKSNQSVSSRSTAPQAVN